MNVTRLLSALALLSLIGLALTIPASSSYGQTPTLSVKISAPADGATCVAPPDSACATEAYPRNASTST